MDRAGNTNQIQALVLTAALAIALWVGAAGAEIAPVFAHDVATPVSHTATFEDGIESDAESEPTELDFHRPNAAPGIAPYFHRSSFNLSVPTDVVQTEGTCGVRGGHALARTPARILEGC